ncbi:hypothetical protein C3L33_11651, partial [Rhododendron williamsianum]
RGHTCGTLLLALRGGGHVKGLWHCHSDGITIIPSTGGVHTNTRLHGLTRRRRPDASDSGGSMAIADRRKSLPSEAQPWKLCPFWQSRTASSSSTSSTQNLHNSQSSNHQNGAVPPNPRPSSKVSSVARSILPTRRRLRLDPSNNLYFPYEPGKQVRSAVRIKNTSSSHVASSFKLLHQRAVTCDHLEVSLLPEKALLQPLYFCSFVLNLIAVFKFVEPPEKPPENNEKQPDQKSKEIDQKCKVKFKIMSLKVKEGMDYIPELFEEQKDQVAVERVLRVVFLDVERSSPALEKLKRQLAEAEAELETRKKPPADTGPRVVGEGLVIDEWKERREKYLARQQVEAIDSM